MEPKKIDCPDCLGNGYRFEPLQGHADCGCDERVECYACEGTGFVKED